MWMKVFLLIYIKLFFVVLFKGHMKMIFSISMKMISIRIMQLKLKMFTKSLENGNMSPKQVPCRNGFKKDEMNFFS